MFVVLGQSQVAVVEEVEVFFALLSVLPLEEAEVEAVWEVCSSQKHMFGGSRMCSVLKAMHGGDVRGGGIVGRRAELLEAA